MGKVLMMKLSTDELETHLFGIVSLRNCDMSSISSGEERLELAKLNLEAGMKVRMFILSIDYSIYPYNMQNFILSTI